MTMRLSLHIMTSIGVEIREQARGAKGRYRLTKMLGGGITGNVWYGFLVEEFEDYNPPPSVAVKVYKGVDPEGDRDKEVSILNRLEGLCDVVACVVDQGVAGSEGAPCMMMSLVDGAIPLVSLTGWTSRIPQGDEDSPKNTDIERIMTGVMRQLTEGINSMHEQGVAHLDLHAGNILLTNRGMVTEDEWFDAFPGLCVDSEDIDVLTYLKTRAKFMSAKTSRLRRLKAGLSVLEDDLADVGPRADVEEQIARLKDEIQEEEALLDMDKLVARLTTWVEDNLDFEIRVIDFDRAVVLSPLKVLTTPYDDPSYQPPEEVESESDDIEIVFDSDEEEVFRTSLFEEVKTADPYAHLADVWQVGQIALWLVNGRRLLENSLNSNVFVSFELTPEGVEWRKTQNSLSLEQIVSSSRGMAIGNKALPLLGKYWSGRAEIPYPYNDLSDSMNNDPLLRPSMQDLADMFKSV